VDRKKLVLKRETVRLLTDDALERVVGGTTYPDTECGGDTYSQGCYTYTCGNRRYMPTSDQTCYPFC
jgi:hypothetical protein